MESSWPSRKRKWKVLKIVVTTCFYLLRFCRNRDEDEWDDTLGNPDFRLLYRTTSTSSRKSLSALDVGLGEEDTADEPLSSFQTRKVSGSSQQLQTRQVYKLTPGMTPGESLCLPSPSLPHFLPPSLSFPPSHSPSPPTYTDAGDYVVKGNSSYIADKIPRWSSDTEEPLPSLSPSYSITSGLRQSATYGNSTCKCSSLPTTRRKLLIFMIFSVFSSDASYE